MNLPFEFIGQLVGDCPGTYDVACPFCGPQRHDPNNRTRRVFRIWLLAYGFATFSCIRCGKKGSTASGWQKAIDHSKMIAIKKQMAARDADRKSDQLRRIRYLVGKSRAAESSVVETYLRDVRGYTGTIPSTLRYLPEAGEHPPAMIGLFGIPEEPEPGRLKLSRNKVSRVHLTRLKPDGSGKAGAPSKIMLGESDGNPLVIAPMNDMLGLAICEGIEDGLSLHLALGIGVWVAGSASQLPSLAEAVPSYTDFVTIFADHDPSGREYADRLAEKIRRRGIDGEIRLLAMEVVSNG